MCVCYLIRNRKTECTAWISNFININVCGEKKKLERGTERDQRSRFRRGGNSAGSNARMDEFHQNDNSDGLWAGNPE